MPVGIIGAGMGKSFDAQAAVPRGQAMRRALREMMSFICGRTNLSREQAYQFCSLAVDFHVTQTVNGEKGVHGMLRKGLLF